MPDNGNEWGSSAPHLACTPCVSCFVRRLIVGIVQKVFSQKASAIARMRQKCVRNTSKMRQKCAKMGLVLLGKEERSKMRQKCVKIASKMRQKCAEHLWGRTPFGRYRNRGGNRSAFRLPWRGIMSIVRWNLRPVIFGVEISLSNMHRVCDRLICFMRLCVLITETSVLCF